MFFKKCFSVIFVCALVGDVKLLDFLPKGKWEPSLQVKTKNGVIQGKPIVPENGHTFYAYFGIPYGEPPVNDLRFREPRMFTRTWPGVLDATKEGKTCVEFLFFSKNWDVVGDEDCLYLNVYTPKLPQKIKQSLSVMVWLYGGAFREGSSKINVYGPDYLLAGNVIVVTFNYRVGTLGFLNTGDLESPGNYGLKDQHLALRWVKENIQHFGGNPKRVTIFGESAGAASVAYHLLSERSYGLFQAAILQSGTSLSAWTFQTEPKKVAFEFGLALGIETKSSKKLMEKLRRVDIEKLKQAIPRLFVANLPELGGQATFAPSIEPHHENAFITKHSYSAFQNGNFTKVPIMMGVNSQESNLFSKFLEIGRTFLLVNDLSPQSMVTSAMNVKPNVNKRELGLCIINHYFEGGSISGSNSQELGQFYSDVQFVRPITKTAKLISGFTPVYFYLFKYEGSLGRTSIRTIFHLNVDNFKGSAHYEEVNYLWKFGLLKTKNFTNSDRYISKVMAKLWTNFAKFRNPTPSKEAIFQNIMWPTTNLKNDFSYLTIGSKLKINQNYRKENMDFWDDLYKTYSNGPIDTF